MPRKLLGILSGLILLLFSVAGCNKILVVTQPQTLTLPGQIQTLMQTTTVPGQTSTIVNTQTITNTLTNIYTTQATLTATGVPTTVTVVPGARVMLAEMFTGDW